MTAERFISCTVLGLLVLSPFYIKGDPPGMAPADSLIVPPQQYDYKYSGRIVLTRGSEARTKADCQGVSNIGCAIRVSAQTCYVWIADDDVLKRHRYSYDMVLLHETAHCNGWKPNLWK